MLSAVIGVKLDEAELYEIGHRINTLERAFNVREGVTRKDDVLPKRLLRGCPEISRLAANSNGSMP